jgi:hypothetical protein
MAAGAAATGGARPKMGFLGLAAWEDVDSDEADTLAESLQSELTAIDAFEVISQKDLAAILGLERQKQLASCSEDTECVAEIAGELNIERVLMGQVNRVDGHIVLNVSVLDPKKATVVLRVSRTESSFGALDGEARAIAYEVVNSDPLFAATPFEIEYGFGGTMVGVLGDVDVLGLQIAPGIIAELSARKWVGASLTVLPKLIPGARLEGRFYPLTTKRLRVWLEAGVTAFSVAVGPRGGAGAAIRFGVFHVFVDVAYERLFAVKPSIQTNAIVTGFGVGLLL